MILLAALLVAFLVALLVGGKVSRLAALPVRLPSLALLGFGLQVYLLYWPDATAPALFSPHTIILIASYLLLLIFVWINRRLPGMFIIGLGLLMNLTVMVANGGYMPITPEAVTRVGHEYELQTTEPGARLRNTKDVLLPREQTNLWFLSDIFVAPRPFPIPSVFSPGDVVVALGAAVLLIVAMRRPEAPPAQS